MAKILVVDDDRSNIEIVIYVLQRDGYEIISASDGEDAFQKVINEKPDLVLLDVMMPQMDGYTMASRMATDDSLRSIPLIVLTAKSGMKDSFQELSNVKAYLEKPFSATDLRANVHKVLKKIKGEMSN